MPRLHAGAKSTLRGQQPPRGETSPTLRVDDADGPHPAILRLCRLIAAIPEGKICTYGQLAAAMGWPRHARIVGRFLNQSSLADGLPWHRVVGAGGVIRPRDGAGANRQRSRLLREGVNVSPTGRVSVSTYLWSPPD